MKNRGGFSAIRDIVPPKRGMAKLFRNMGAQPKYKNPKIVRAKRGWFIALYYLQSELREYSINLTSHRISVFKSNETIIESALKKIEENEFSVTYIGAFKTGIEFRLVTLGKTTETIIKSSNTKPFITIASKNLNGYAVTYELK